MLFPLYRISSLSHSIPSSQPSLIEIQTLESRPDISCNCSWFSNTRPDPCPCKGTAFPAPHPSAAGGDRGVPRVPLSPPFPPAPPPPALGERGGGRQPADRAPAPGGAEGGGSAASRALMVSLNNNTDNNNKKARPAFFIDELTACETQPSPPEVT